MCTLFIHVIFLRQRVSSIDSYWLRLTAHLLKQDPYNPSHTPDSWIDTLPFLVLFPSCFSLFVHAVPDFHSSKLKVYVPIRYRKLKILRVVFLFLFIIHSGMPEPKAYCSMPILLTPELLPGVPKFNHQCFHQRPTAGPPRFPLNQHPHNQITSPHYAIDV